MTDDTNPHGPKRRTRLRRRPAAAPSGATLGAPTGVAQPPSPRTDTDPQQWRSINHPVMVGFLLTLGGLLAFALGIAFTNLSTIIIYIVFALFAALGLDPVVRMFERHHVSRAWGIVIVYAIFALIIAGVLLIIVPAAVDQISQLIKNIPAMVADFQKSDFYAWLTATFGNITDQVTKQVQKFLSNPANVAAIGGGILKVGVGIASAISGLLIILVLSLYFLAGLPTIKQAFTTLLPARNRPIAASLTDQITDSVGGYLGGMVILAFCNSVVAFFLHLFIGLPYPALMAVVAFLITLIPLIGSVLYLIVATGIALFSSPTQALIFGVIYLVYIQIEAYVLTPRVMNKTISVPGALVVIGAMVGGTLLGLLGALVAIPVTAAILLIIKQIFIPKQDAKV
ncbi:permease [Microbacterium mangrovi]|uniref:Permease n=1 Tax=Microbacterium mangrovi TaxID=1348253 RepID=A0A0B2A2Q0_9MICO|nr:AI-2E family transporter [Microbacterium mangrovi]KHK96094.1 permease [Microbacterium mangrovi]